jgi:Superinfection immunity protein
MEAGLMLLFLAVAFYFLPTIVGFAKGKQNAGAIFVLNFFLGWTLVGWGRMSNVGNRGAGEKPLNGDSRTSGSGAAW